MTTTHSFENSFKDKLQYIKATVDPQFLLEHLGFKVFNKNRHELRCACKVHGGDNETSFRFNLETRTWVCFSHKCHDIYGNDIIGLIKATNGCNFMAAVEYLKNMVGGIDDFDTKIVAYKYRKQREDHTATFFPERHVPAIVSESNLLKFKQFRSDRFIKDGFKQETLDYFEIAGGYTDKNDPYIRDIIPIRDSDGYLVAYSLRDIRDDVSDNKKKYRLTPDFDKDSVLYNLNNIKDLLLIKPLILVEGFKSVWRLYEYGIHNVAAVIGSSVTIGQLNLIMSFAYQGCVLFFDNDPAGILCTSKACEDLNGKIKVIPQFITEIDEKGKGLDPSDLTKEQVHTYLNGLF
ncbi:MAG TPA: toprim domain-containing protein [Patescibacteria group bacterium]|nr:toprim domain-containing protein [Patescibacteria group bacterium]